MTLVNLFWSYELFPDVYKDNQFNIPESGNGIPDILDESKWEIEWILKMQDPVSGGFYAQVQSDDDGNITKRIIKDTVDGNTDVKPTEPTACAAAALAQASIVYQKTDAAFALNVEMKLKVPGLFRKKSYWKLKPRDLMAMMIYPAGF